MSSDTSSATNASKIRPSYALPKTHNKLNPGLYIVATPIGNLQDITIRALEILSKADLILCEDTRVTRKLLNAYQIDQELIAYHDHNADKMRPRVMQALADNKIVAQASDAGTPLISDPGYKLVKDAITEGHPVIPIPGASAPLTALAAAGLPSDKFLFIGFLPTKSKAKRDFLVKESQSEATLICFESPKRLISSLEVIAQIWPSREIVVARELTKLFEEFKRGTAIEVYQYYQNSGTPKGEVVILLEPLKNQQQTEEDLEQLLEKSLINNSVRDAAAIVAEITGLPKKEVYKRALEIHKNTL